MNRERYMELAKNPELKLTEEEIREGWFFCNCEWDGMLIHDSHVEAEFCGCRKVYLEGLKENK